MMGCHLRRSGSPAMSNRRKSSNLPQSMKVVEAVADELGIDSTEVETPLLEVIDPDALDALFRGQGRSGMVRFSYYGYRVVVQEDGQVVLTDDR
ncbi:HalOD1 output domain-containing protein [Halorubrum trueperi]|uniref:HalOD1 output domain-containing protein n=1 Tax=Halorubrum trueperi TaxID=2004704 RepID=A0ABD5UHL0_9EURY